ncbi:MAG: hypothetical protein ACE5MG_13625 [Candidatus Methylomirabilales bacterium]
MDGAIDQIRHSGQQEIMVEKVASGVEEFVGWVFTALKMFIGLALIVLVMTTESPHLLLAVLGVYGLFFLVAGLYILQDAKFRG